MYLTEASNNVICLIKDLITLPQLNLIANELSMTVKLIFYYLALFNTHFAY